MTVTQAAEKIGISPSKLYQLAGNRQIAHYRIGGKIIFSEQDVAAFLEACRVGTAAPVMRKAPPVRPVLRHLSVGNR
jgi:excisionase family DNA binding protein